VQVDLLLRRPNCFGRGGSDLLRPPQSGREYLVGFDDFGEEVRLEDVLRDGSAGEEVGSDLRRVVDGVGDSSYARYDAPQDLRKGDLGALAANNDVCKETKVSGRRGKRKKKKSTAVRNDLRSSAISVSIQRDDERLLGASTSERTETVDVRDEFCIRRSSGASRGEPVFEILFRGERWSRCTETIEKSSTYLASTESPTRSGNDDAPHSRLFLRPVKNLRVSQQSAR
jgi:hypothetical protein